MPSPSFLNELSEEDAKNVLMEICRSPNSAQNLERIVRCLLQFWDPARCALVIDKDIVPEIFPNLRYGPAVVHNTDISSLSILDIKVFLHLCLHCAYVRGERTKEKAGTNTRKFPNLTASEQLTTEWQRSWWRAAWSLCNGIGKQEDRIRLQEGLETLRLKSRDPPELPLLLSVAAMLEAEVPDASRFGGNDGKAVAASDYGKIYWTAIDQILERDRTLQPKPDAMFYAGLPPLPRSRRDHYRSLAKYYHALNALLHGKEDEGVTILEQLQTPQAFYALAQIYKNSAERVVGRQGDQDVELRRRALLVKAKDALQATMEKLNAQASNGGLGDLEVTKALEEVNASLASAPSYVPSPASTPAAAADLSNISAVTPVASSTVGFTTPPSRFLTSRSFSGNTTQASASLLMELGQSVDFALRTLTQSQETLVRGIMDQNRALTSTCDGLIAQLRELTLTNKSLVEEMKEMRREFTAASVKVVPTEKAPAGDQEVLNVGKLKESKDNTDSAPPKSTVEEVKPPLSQLEMFKPKPGSWACKDCYTRNDAFAARCVCCGGASPHAPVGAQSPAPPPQSTMSIFASPATSSIFGQGVQAPKFGLPPPPASVIPPPPASVIPPPSASGIPPTSIVPTALTTSATSFPLFAPSTPSSGLSFASVAAQNTSTPAKPTNAAPTPSLFQSFQGFKGFQGAGTPVLGDVKASTPGRTRQESENDDSTDTPFEPTAEFKPVIPLPALVEVKSGEEDEEVLFRERAKLYRWGVDLDGKEGFKERGLGDLKILKHPETGRVRILMRREQVLKICANHTIVAGMKLAPMKNSDRAFTWHCQDFADGELSSETFAVRFKEVEQAKKFKEVFETAAESSKVLPTGKAPAGGQEAMNGGNSGGNKENTDSTPTKSTSAEAKPPLSQLEMFKPKPGSWECKDCYTRNDVSADKCVCCGIASACSPAPTQASAVPPRSTPSIFASPVAPSIFGQGVQAPKFGPLTAAAPPTTTTTAPATGSASTTSFPVFGASQASTRPTFAAVAAQNASSPPAPTTTAPSTSPFQSFQGFKGFQGAGAPLFGGVKTTTPERTRQESENDDSTDTPFEPTAEFKPVIPLPALVEVKSGEEGEEILFRERAKLYRWGLDMDGKEGFKERGVGDLKILKHGETGRVRVLMRREQVLKVCANHTIAPGMKLTPMKSSDRAFTWHCQDFADGELKSETFAVRFKEVEQAKKFKEVFETAAASSEIAPLKDQKVPDIGKSKEPKENIDSAAAKSTVEEGVKPPLSQLEMFKPKPGSWACKDCYTRNDATAAGCVCCGSANPNAPVSTQSSAPPQSTLSIFGSSPATSSIFGQGVQAPKFGLPPPTASSIPPTSVAATGSPSTTSLPVFGASKPSAGLTFAALAAQNASAPAPAGPTGTAPSSSPFQSFQGFKGFQGAGTPLFGGVKTTTPERTRQESENDDSTDTPFEPTAEFKPVIPLPALVEVKSGEEDEEALFRERAKLYRWGVDMDGKEGFKERGVGDLKILKHGETGRVRILMRREQVLKICANHTIAPGMKLSPMKSSDRAFTWHCQDFADGELKSETFAVRFKDAEQAKKFKEVFEAAAASSSDKDTGSSGKAGGDTGKGQTIKETGGTSSEDISIVYETKANREQESMAEQYQLPKTFYVEHPPCPGCIGCASDEAQDNVLRQLDHKEE